VNKYYHILRLQPGASLEEIKRAYRQLAKEFHPDVNADPEARRKFIEIQLAYEWLLQNRETQRFSYSTQYDRRPEAKRNPDPAYRPRHQYYAAPPKRTPPQEEAPPKWLARAHRVSNIVFILFSLLIMAVPIYKFIEQQDLPPDQQRSFLFFVVPMAAGALFCGWGYYYWFILKSDER
jgi:hypothetical protein